MFARLIARITNIVQLRRSTAFLLERGDDHLLDDIGLTRDDLIALRRGEDVADALVKSARLQSTPVPRGLPVGASA